MMEAANSTGLDLDSRGVDDDDGLTKTTEFHGLTTGMQVYGYVLVGLILVMGMVCLVWTCRNKHKSVVKASQPCFLELICLGVVLFGSSIFPMSVDDEFASTEESNQVRCDITTCCFIDWMLPSTVLLTFACLLYCTR